jgi:hypothetical protein
MEYQDVIQRWNIQKEYPEGIHGWNTQMVYQDE